jgi:hypothetical protein
MNRWILFEIDLVDEMLHRAITPFINLLSQQKLDMAAPEVS